MLVKNEMTQMDYTNLIQELQELREQHGFYSCNKQSDKVQFTQH
jgi:hypothetical protein